jgi:hypothetical protein
MSADPADKANVREVVPFFGILDMERSLRYYVDGLGFEIKNKWIVNGKVRWCWLVRGGAPRETLSMSTDGKARMKS